MIKDQINTDLKAALLSGDKDLANILRVIKSSILYAEVAQNKRDVGLADDEIVKILAKEAKKRQESADLYAKGNAPDRAAAELHEKTIIEKYLPAQLSESEIEELIEQEFAKLEEPAGQKHMGMIIGTVKQRAGPNVDGSTVAMLVKKRLQN